MRAGQVEAVDAGHLVPMEQPARVVEAALRMIASEGGRSAWPGNGTGIR
jgi:hypothetical protein